MALNANAKDKNINNTQRSLLERMGQTRFNLRRFGLKFSLAAAFMSAAAPMPAQAAGPTQASIIVNADTGNVLFSRNAETAVYPASTTKLMTAYLTFDALKSGRLRLDQRLTVSRNAAGQPTTNLGMMSYSSRRVPNGTYKDKKGRTIQRYRTVQSSSQNTTTITVENALKGLMVHSGNDAAVVLAEALGGSTAGFATMMNNKARQLGMTNSNFVNPNGLPNAQQRTTAHDMTRLMSAILQNHPNYYDQFLGVRHFSFNGNSWNNTNRLLDSTEAPGVDGGKTGYIRASGFNIVLSAERNDQRIIVGVFGGASGASRDAYARNLVNFGFFKMVRDANATYDTERRYEVVMPPARVVAPPVLTPSVTPLPSPYLLTPPTGATTAPVWPQSSSSLYFPFNGAAAPTFQLPMSAPAPQESAAPLKTNFSTGGTSYQCTYRFA